MIFFTFLFVKTNKPLCGLSQFYLFVMIPRSIGIINLDSLTNNKSSLNFSFVKMIVHGHSDVNFAHYPLDQ